MIDFEIVWIKDPVEDILDIGSLGQECAFSCGSHCKEKTPDSCTVFCEGVVS